MPNGSRAVGSVEPGADCDSDSDREGANSSNAGHAHPASGSHRGGDAAAATAADSESQQHQHQQQHQQVNGGDARHGSPLQHRRHRATAPVEASPSRLVDDHNDDNGNGSRTQARHTPNHTATRKLIPTAVTEGSENYNSNGNDATGTVSRFATGVSIAVHEVDVSFPNSNKTTSDDDDCNGSNSNGGKNHHKKKNTKRIGSGGGRVGGSNANGDANPTDDNAENNRDAASNGRESPRSPVPVTLLGVGNDLRRKRIKKVSNYTLGPLLGEGSYGVVRDALDVSGERVTRCAVKLVNSVGGGSSAGNSSGYNNEEEQRSPMGRRMFQSSREDLSLALAQALSTAPAADSGGEDESNSSTVAAADDDGGAGPVHRRRDQQQQNLSNNNTNSGGGSSGGLKRCTRESVLRQAFEQESLNLQRFHNKHIIRAMDIFSRHGKQYIVLPIAICSLEQLLEETERTRAKTDTTMVETARRMAAAAEEAARLEREAAAVAAKRKRREGRAAAAAAAAANGRNIPAVSIIGQDERFEDDDYNDEDDDEDEGSTASAASSFNTVLDVSSGHASPRPPPALPPLAPITATETPAASMLPAMLVKGIMSQLVSGLSYLHQQNLAHNDVKPSNILLFESGTVRLTDLGSVGERFTDKGTPMCASPELCRDFYGINNNDTTSGARQSSPAAAAAALTDVDAKKGDMWCCGLVLYYLITGRSGPLPVHAEFDRIKQQQQQQHHAFTGTNGNSSRSSGGCVSPLTQLPPSSSTPTAAAPLALLTRYQVFREIASEKLPVNLDDLPDLIADSGSGSSSGSKNNANASANAATAANSNTNTGSSGGPITTAHLLGPSNDTNNDSSTSAAVASRYPPNSVRDLLSRLLDVDPSRRITAAEALAHPWLTLTFKSSSDKNKPKPVASTSTSSSTAAAAAAEEAAAKLKKKAPSRQAMEEAIQRDVAKRVLQSAIVKQMIRRDRERHLQFVCDVVHILGMDIPSEVFMTTDREPFDDPDGSNNNTGGGGAVAGQPEDGDEAARRRFMPPRGGGGGGSGPPNATTTTTAVDGMVVSPYIPAEMPPGCVDASLFLPFDEENYYQQKSGKTEFDVRAFREYPVKMRAIKEYFQNVALVRCGYRTGADPFFSIHSIGADLTAMLRRNQNSSNNLPAAAATSGSTGGGLLAASSSSSSAAAAADGSHHHTTGTNNKGAGAAAGAASPSSLSSAAAAAGGGAVGVTPMGGHDTNNAAAVPVGSQPANASAIMGSVVIQTNGRNSLQQQSRRGLSIGAGRVRSPSAASGVVVSTPVTATTSGGGQRRGHSRAAGGGRGGGAYDGAAGERDVAMQESSKCFCGLV